MQLENQFPHSPKHLDVTSSRVFQTGMTNFLISLGDVFTHVSECHIATEIASRVNDFQARVRSRAHTQPLYHRASSFIATGIDCNWPSPNTRKPYSVAFALPGTIVFTRIGQLHAFLFPLDEPRCRGSRHREKVSDFPRLLRRLVHADEQPDVKDLTRNSSRLLRS